VKIVCQNLDIDFTGHNPAELLHIFVTTIEITVAGITAQSQVPAEESQLIEAETET
jgi:hypothetical protein